MKAPLLDWTYTVDFGPWEPDPERPPRHVHQHWNGSFVEHTSCPSLRRKRFEKWQDADGETRGRWDWERA